MLPMETLRAFVILSVHDGVNADGEKIRYIQARFQITENEWLTAFNPKGVAKCDLVKRINHTTGETEVQTRRPVIIRFQRDTVCNSNVVRRCELIQDECTSSAMQSRDVGQGSSAILSPQQPHQTRIIHRKGRADCIMELSKPFRLVVEQDYGGGLELEDEDDLRAAAFRCVQIGNHKSSISHLMVEVVVFILLDTYPSEAKEYHVARFYPEDWDKLVDWVHEGYTVVLKNSTVAYDRTNNETIINTVEHWDYVNPDGSIDGTEVGVFKRYISGWVEACDSIVLSINVDFEKNSHPPEKLILPRFDELRESDRKKRKERRIRNLFEANEIDNNFEYSYGDSNDEPDWGEDSGWNDLYGDDVEASDIIEFRD